MFWHRVTRRLAVLWDEWPALTVRVLLLQADVGRLLLDVALLRAHRTTQVAEMDGLLRAAHERHTAALHEQVGRLRARVVALEACHDATCRLDHEHEGAGVPR